MTEGYSLALPAHPWPAKQCELLPETGRHFTARGVRPIFTARTMNDDRALALVQAGLGLTVMPDGYAAPGVARPRLANFEHARQIGLLWLPAAECVGMAPSQLLDTIRTT